MRTQGCNVPAAPLFYMTKTIGYCRVSLDKQAERGLSLEAQREKLQAYSKVYDLELVEIIVDAGQSAKSLDRPGLQKALKLLRAKKSQALVVAKLDRLTRSVRDLGELLEEHFAPGKSDLMAVDMQIDTRTAAGRMILNILTSIGQWERETIGERTSAVMQLKKSRGEFTGGAVPFGYKLGPDGKLLTNPVEQKAIAEALRLRVEGLSLRAIAAKLAPQVGRRLGPAQIMRLLRFSGPPL